MGKHAAWIHVNMCSELNFKLKCLKRHSTDCLPMPACKPEWREYALHFPTAMMNICILLHSFLYQYMLTTEQLLQTYAYYYTGYAFYCTFPELLPIYATYSTLCVLLPILSFTLQYRRIAIPRSIGAVRPLSGTIVVYVSASLFPRTSTPFAFF